MPRQPELISPGPLSIAPPKGMQEPPLWVRRVTIWENAEKAPIRDIELGPGLNIVWSPDATDSTSSDQTDDGIGHGSGKTLFCRLVRYCLGEPRYANEDQRYRIAEAFPDGFVGAEVVVAGVSWSVIRPFAPRRPHYCAANRTIEETLKELPEAGIEPFLVALLRTLAVGTQELVPGAKDGGDAWLTALAWLSRDQECRFNHPLNWRAAESDTDSPAKGLSRADQLDALRAFIRAIILDEKKVRQEVAAQRVALKSREQERDHLTWLINQTRARLTNELGLDEGSVVDGQLGAIALQTAARERVTAVTADATEDDVGAIRDVRAARNAAQHELNQLLEEQAKTEARIPEIERMITRMQSEMPGLSFSQLEAQSPACPVCEVPIDRALAEGCKLSHRLPDLTSIRERRANLEQELRQERADLDDLKQRRENLSPEVALARQRLDNASARLSRLEDVQETRDVEWYGSRRLADQADDHAGSITALDALKQEIREIERKIESGGATIAAHRDRQASVFANLTEKFDAIVKELLGKRASGRATLSGNGLELKVNLGGERSTAAIDSLKIIAFDLAALSMAIEGRTASPPFLIHDSPREADLGLSIYHILLRLAQRLEGFGDQPLFQYIVTTTTRPPDELAKSPWLRLALRGSPSAERLLRQDL